MKHDFSHRRIERIVRILHRQEDQHEFERIFHRFLFKRRQQLERHYGDTEEAAHAVARDLQMFREAIDIERSFQMREADGAS